jgi:catechol 2,3-dioxygenase-like lactoylglutathione lyase family enzyme
MTLQRMDNVLIVVEDLEAAKAFFAELGMELEGETTVEGPSVDQTVGLNDVRADITMMRTPDGHGRVELSGLAVEPEDVPNAFAGRSVGERCVGAALVVVVDPVWQRLSTAIA